MIWTVPEPDCRDMRALLIRMAKQLDIELEAHGSRFEDRSHETSLGSPNQVRNTLKCVLENHANHVKGAIVDPDSSGPWFSGWPEAMAITMHEPNDLTTRSWLAAGRRRAPESERPERRAEGLLETSARTIPPKPPRGSQRMARQPVGHREEIPEVYRRPFARSVARTISDQREEAGPRAR
jgi:hypothetical protein